MTNQTPELRPDPYVGGPDVNFDPSEQPGDFPFQDFESAKASELEFTGEVDSTEPTESDSPV